MAEPTFNKIMRGYDPEQVDTYLANTTATWKATLDKANGKISDQNQRIATLIQEQEKALTQLETLQARIGDYEKKAVEHEKNARRLAQENEQLKADRTSLNKTINQLKADSKEPFRMLGSLAQETVDQASKIADEMQQNARKEAERLLTNAKETASSLMEKATNDAHAMSDKTKQDTEAMLADARKEAERIRTEALDYANQQQAIAEEAIGQQQEARQSVQTALDAINGIIGDGMPNMLNRQANSFRHAKPVEEASDETRVMPAVRKN